MITNKIFLVFAVSFQLVFAPTAALGQATPAPAKRKPARTLTPVEMNEKLVQLRAAAFENAAANSWTIKTSDDFMKTYLMNLSEQDRKDVMSYVSKDGPFPRLQVNGLKLETVAGPKVTFAWPDLKKEIFEVNGVTWAYDKAQPLKKQVEALLKKINDKKHASHPLQKWILPEAEADGGVSMAILMMVVGVLIGTFGPDLFTGPYCAAIKFLGGRTQRCISFEKEKRDAAKNTPPSDEVVNMSGSDTRNVVARFEAQDFTCPSNNDGKDRIYRGRVRTVQSRDGKKVPTSEWFQIVRKYSAAGAPTDLIVTMDNTGDPAKLDTTSPEGASKLIVHIAFDPTTRQPVSFRVPNKNRGTSVLSSNTVNLNEMMDLTVEQRDIIDNAIDIYKYSIFRVYNCVTQDVVAEQQAGIESGSPTAPKPGPQTAPGTTH